MSNRNAFRRFLDRYPGAAEITLSVILGLLRIFGFKSQTFQAISHLWTGALLGGWRVGGNRVLLWIAIGLSVVEAAVFVWTGVFHPVHPAR